MHKLDLSQKFPSMHATRRDASTEPAELEVIVPANPRDLTPAAARASLHLLTDLANRPL